MHDLGVAVPDVLTRVSEYIQPVIDYIQKLVDQGPSRPSGLSAPQFLAFPPLGSTSVAVLAECSPRDGRWSHRWRCVH